jgi:3-hydroxybutyryl-CoA dehydrogenase
MENPMSIEEVGVVGTGTMGHGIAQVLAQHGCRVRLYDAVPAAVDTALARIGKSLDRLGQKGHIAPGLAQETLARLFPCTTLDALADCELVIEAASENEDIKRKIFDALDTCCRPSALLASNTSSIPISRIAGWTRRPAQVIGMHFMNPVPLMPLVEIVRAPRTDESCLQRVADLARRVGKTPVTVNDAPGFVSNRILMPMINEAAFALYEGVAGAGDIDAIMTLGMNHPLGPLALADLIGLDTCLAIMDVLYHEFRDSKYRACPLLARKVAAGELGRKSGAGFYSYAENG